MAQIKIYNAETLGKPLGQYSHIARVKAGELLFISGMLSADGAGNVVGKDDFDAQCTQVFKNIDVYKRQGKVFARPYPHLQPFPQAEDRRQHPFEPEA